MAKDAKPTDEETTVKDKAPKEATVSTAKAEWAIERSASHHYTDMAKITAGLLVGVLALMVFLLSVGLQHPKPMIRTFLYTSFVALGLSLLAYQLGVLMEAKATSRGALASATRGLGVVRVLQQLIFAVAIIATVGFAISASQLFFVSAAATSTQGQ